MREKRGILRGLDSDNVIETTSHAEEPASSDDEGFTAPGRRRTTRQAVYGRQEALYNVKYHPMDDIVRPANAAKHRGHAVIRHHDGDEEEENREDMSQLGSDNADDEDERPAKRRRSDGTRHSDRPGTQRAINYSTQHHPQDAQLRLIGRNIVPSKSRSQKPKRSKEIITVPDDDSSESTGDEIEVARSHPRTGRRFSPSVLIPDSTASHEEMSEEDHLLSEIYPEPYTEFTPSHTPVQATRSAPQGLFGMEGSQPQFKPPKGSLVVYSDSDDDIENEDKNSTPSGLINSEVTGVDSPKARTPPEAKAHPDLIYSSDVSFSLQVSAGQVGKAFSRPRMERRIANERFAIYQDLEEKHISIVSRAATEMLARESDLPKENFRERQAGDESESQPSDNDVDTELPVERLSPTRVPFILAPYPITSFSDLDDREELPEPSSSHFSEAMEAGLGRSGTPVESIERIGAGNPSRTSTLSLHEPLPTSSPPSARINLNGSSTTQGASRTTSLEEQWSFSPKADLSVATSKPNFFGRLASLSQPVFSMATSAIRSSTQLLSGGAANSEPFDLPVTADEHLPKPAPATSTPDAPDNEIEMQIPADPRPKKSIFGHSSDSIVFPSSDEPEDSHFQDAIHGHDV